EALLDRREAKLILRPVLYCNNEPVSLDLLEEPRLTIVSQDLDGISSSHVVEDLKLKAAEDTVVPFRVPNRLQSIHFQLTAKVKSITAGKKVDVTHADSFALNSIDRTHHTEAMLLLQIDGQWALDLLGKTGEPLGDRPVQLKLKHRDFTDPVDVTLESDPAGRIRLGKLTDITHVYATSPEGVSQQWMLPNDEHTYPSNINGLAGQRIAVPYMGSADKPTRADLMLVQVNGGQFVRDWFESLTIEGGFVVLEDLPAADYVMQVKPAGATIRIRLTAGQTFESYAVSPTRALQVRNASPLQIVSVDAGGKELAVQLANVSAAARVHVLATRFKPEYDAYGHLAAPPMPEPETASLAPANSGYVSGRDLGDEYRYILDRKYAAKFPGNMLRRPSLLLNPWALRDTQTGRQEAAEGGRFGLAAGNASGSRSSFFGRGGEERDGGGPVTPNLNFLADQSAVLTNLRPDENGRVVIPRDKLGLHQQIRVVAVDLWNTASRDVSIAEPEVQYLDLRLADALDAEKRFAQTKVVSVLPGGKAFTVPDAASSRIEVYDSLGKVFGLYRTLNPDPKLAEFAFILRWPTLKDAEKRELYSEYACHELNFFLYHKDKAFFQAVVLPYLAHKKDKTFMDRYLLGENLAEYRQPWRHERLNIPERVLLARRIAAEAPATARHVRELWELIPPNPAEYARLFETAVRGQALTTVAGIGGMVRDKMLDVRRPTRPDAAATRTARSRGAFLNSGDVAEATPAPAADPMPETAPPAPREAATKAKVDKAQELQAQDEMQREFDKKPEEADAYADDADGDRRESVRRMYRKVDSTKEWVENNYYKLPIEQQVASLVPVNGFWKDYALHVTRMGAAGENGDGFLS
ncbi:MAG: hypothetical protein KGY81_10595, partial [Phycisphaerae bacterium]|nr:hypothetical protein [Phycisphaerae bacterium]